MLHEKDLAVKPGLARAHSRPQAGGCTDRQGTPVALPAVGLVRRIAFLARNLVFARKRGESMPDGSRRVCLYARQEVPFEESPEGLVRWKLASGRSFLFDEGIVYVFDGLHFLPLSQQPDWKAGIQFSLGFDAGRTLRRLWDEVPRR